MLFKIYNTTKDKVVSTAVSIADKTYLKNDIFLTFAFSKNGILEEFDKILWTFSSQKFIPHILTNDKEYLMFKDDVKNIVSYNLDEIYNFLKKNKLHSKTPITMLLLNNDIESNSDNLQAIVDIANEFINDFQISFAIIFASDNNQISSFGESVLKFIKSKEISHEIWQNFDFGWEMLWSSLVPQSG